MTHTKTTCTKASGALDQREVCHKQLLGAGGLAYEDPRVHGANCRLCNNGRGWQANRTGQNNAWYGPFATPEQSSGACRVRDVHPRLLHPEREVVAPTLRRTSISDRTVRRVITRPEAAPSR